MAIKHLSNPPSCVWSRNSQHDFWRRRLHVFFFFHSFDESNFSCKLLIVINSLSIPTSRFVLFYDHLKLVFHKRTRDERKTSLQWKQSKKECVSLFSCIPFMTLIDHLYRLCVWCDRPAFSCPVLSLQGQERWREKERQTPVIHQIKRQLLINTIYKKRVVWKGKISVKAETSPGLLTWRIWEWLEMTEMTEMREENGNGKAFWW